MFKNCVKDYLSLFLLSKKLTMSGTVMLLSRLSSHHIADGRVMRMQVRDYLLLCVPIFLY